MHLDFCLFACYFFIELVDPFNSFVFFLMLTKEDLGQIREVVRDEVTTSEKRVIKTIIEAVGQMIDDNILPQFDEIHEEIKEIKQDIVEIKEDIVEINQEMRSMNAKMMTKGGLEDRLVDFRLSLSGTIA